MNKTNINFLIKFHFKEKIKFKTKALKYKMMNIHYQKLNKDKAK